VRPLAGHTKDVRAVAYCPDGRLVSGGSDRTVRVWDPTTGGLLRTIKAGTPVYAVAASPDGTQFAYAGRHPGADARDTPIQTFLLADDVAGYTFRFPVAPPPPAVAFYYPAGATVPRSVWSLSFTADGRYLAAAGRSLGTGNHPNGAGGHWFRTDDASAHGPLAAGRAYALRFAPDGHRLAVTGEARVEFYAGPREQTPTLAYPLRTDWAAAVGFVPGSPLAVVGVSSALYFVDATEERKPRKVKTGFRTVTAVAAPPDGRAVIVGGRPAGVEVYHPDTGALVVRYDFGLGGVNAVAVAPDGLTFAVAGDDGLAVFDWDG
jgi:WD40 repeat protein